MKSKELGKRLKDGIIDNLYLFYGEEDYIKETYIKRIKNTVLENDITGLNFTQFDEVPSKDEFTEAIESAPIMCDRKIVFLNGFNVCSTSVKKEFKEFFSEVIKDIPEYTVVIIKEKETDAKKMSKPMMTLVKKYGIDIPCESLSFQDLVEFAGRQFVMNKKKIGVNDLNYLVSICDNSINSVLREVEVICSYLNDKENVDRQTIDLLVKKSIEDRVFSLSDAIISGNKKEAYEILKDLKLLKNQHPAGKIYSIVCDHFINMYVVNKNNRERIPQDYTLDLLSLRGRNFLIGKYLKQGSKIELSKLRMIIDKLSELDYKVKNGQSEPYYAIEEIIAIV